MWEGQFFQERQRRGGYQGMGFIADPDLEVIPAVFYDLNTITNGHGDKPPESDAFKCISLHKPYLNLL